MAIGALACLPMAAQNSVFNNPANKAYFGVRVGGEAICPGKITHENVGVSAYKNGGGVEFGAIYNIPVVANFYVEPGLKLYYNTYSMKKDILDDMADNVGVDSFSIRKFGMRVPVMLGYHFDFTEDINVSVFTGPELEVGLSGKAHVKAFGENGSESIYGDEGEYNRFDLVWGVGAGITYSHYYFGVSGGIGMLNMYNTSAVKFHENRVTFTLGYNF